MGQDSVERNVSILVGIETLIEKVAQKASILRNAFAVNALRRGQRIARMFGIGRKVPDRSEATASDDRIGDDVNIFVDLAGLKTAIQMDMTVTRNELAVDRVGELPVSTRNDS